MTQNAAPLAAACAVGGRPQQPVTPPQGGEAGREPARSQAGPSRGGGREANSESQPRSCRPPVRAQEAGSSAGSAPQLRARCRWNPPSPPSALARGTGCPQLAVPGLRGGASPMAEGRRREDEEEELRERRELGGPRRARGRALPGHSAAVALELKLQNFRANQIQGCRFGTCGWVITYHWALVVVVIVVQALVGVVIVVQALVDVVIVVQPLVVGVVIVVQPLVGVVIVVQALVGVVIVVQALVVICIANEDLGVSQDF
ncbi:hypothetical protein LEMLEM_LOCUS15719 [Lemmus lemmus]